MEERALQERIGAEEQTSRFIIEFPTRWAVTLACFVDIRAWELRCGLHSPRSATTPH